MRLPQKPKHMRVDAFVQSHDVMPTLLDILGVPYSRTDGVSAMPLVRGDTESIRNTIVTGWAGFGSGNARAHASVRTRRWNYIVPVHAAEHGEALYDLRTDPDENENVLATHPDEVRRLRRYVEAAVGQPLPAQLNEVTDGAGSPFGTYLGASRKHR
jgi:arylsulfatase A-like enzyme